MELITWSLLVGFLVLVLGKTVPLLISYVKLYKILKKIPQVPAHWLKGNMDKIKDAATYLNLVSSMVNAKGVRMYCVWFGPIPAVGVTHPDTIQQLIKQNNSKGTGWTSFVRFLTPWIGCLSLGNSLAVANGDRWERSRKLLSPAFHLDILKAYIPRMNECADTFLDKIDEASNGGQESIEIMAPLRLVTLETILKCSLSCNDNVQDCKSGEHPYIEAVRDIPAMIVKRAMTPIYFIDFVFNLSSLGRQFKTAVQKGHLFTMNLIVQRQKEIAQERGQVPDNRKLDFLNIVLRARTEEGSHDTTLSGLTWTIYCLSKHLDLQQKVHEEVRQVLGDEEEVGREHIEQMEYLSCFIKEVMRLYSVIAFISRETDRPTVIDGIELPVGTRVDIPISVLHRNPAVWPDPDEFRPDRFNADNRTNIHPYAFIPFSVGKRNCIGQVFSLNEMKIFIAKMVRRFEILADEDHEPIICPNVVLDSENGVKVKLRPRQY